MPAYSDWTMPATITPTAKVTPIPIVTPLPTPTAPPVVPVSSALVGAGVVSVGRDPSEAVGAMVTSTARSEEDGARVSDSDRSEEDGAEVSDSDRSDVTPATGPGVSLVDTAAGEGVPERSSSCSVAGSMVQEPRLISRQGQNMDDARGDTDARPD